MPGFDRTGPLGMGLLTGGGRGLCGSKGGKVEGYHGFGFHGASPPWPYIGRGRGGYARCQYPGFYGTPAYPYPVRDQDIDDLRSQAEAMKEQLKQVEDRIKQMSQES